MTVTNIESARADRKLTISAGSTRFAKKAKQSRLTWSMFADKCREPVRTKERYADYLKLPKSEQDAIKDVGWFVGGRLRNGVRKVDHLESRDLLTLDIDFADENFDFYLDESYGEYTYLCYSTHKHRADSPRLRLVFPLSRSVTPDEYPAIARMVADWWDVEVFDDTTYQASRVMYWPSCSSDGDFAYLDNDAETLDPDAVLAMYDDWTDVASWPVSRRQGEAIERSAQKAADPLEKGGVIGDFCRAYTVPEAIAEFLPHVYEPSETAKDRFSFLGGSTSNGAIVYNEGRFLYSNHGTDPAGGRSMNAFDLVRVHMFGDADKDADEGERVTKLPSYKAMAKLANADDRVNTSRIENLDDDFDDSAEAETPADAARVETVADYAAAVSGEADEGLGFPSTEYTDADIEALKALDRTEDGAVKNHVSNIITILKHDKRLKGCVAWNEFSQDHVLTRDLPGYPVRDKINGDLWQDKHDSFVVAYIHNKYDVEPPKSRLVDAVNMVANTYAFHPVRSYLASVKWDGEKRVDRLLVKWFNAEDTAYTRTVTRKTLVAAVARVFNPGAKFDTMLILEGAQGVGKSSFLRDLARGWFTDSVGSFGKDSVENMKGKWLGEIGELTQFKKAEVEHIKAFLSRQTDRVREAYARRAVDFPRQCVFMGTTNETGEYLKDEENRRFWPVRCRVSSFVGSLSRAEVAQVWAEAVELYRNGESLELDDLEARQQAKAQQAERQADSGAVVELAHWLDEPVGDDFDEGESAPRETVTVLEIFHGFYARKGQPTNGERAQIRKLMKLCPGWSDQAEPRRVDGKPVRVYIRNGEL